MTENNQISMAEAAAGVPAIQQAAVPQQQLTEKTFKDIVEQAEMRQKLTQRLYLIALRATNCNDWIDQSGTPYLEYEGARKIARDIGMSVENVQGQQQNIKDDKGEYIIFTYTGDAVWQGKKTPELGTCSTRDKFFGRKSGEELPLSEVPIVDVMKKAHTNLMNRAIKSALGLSFTWEEIEQATNGYITRQKCTGVSYGAGKKGGTAKKPDTADTAQQRKDVWEWILEYCKGDLGAAEQTLANMTTFKGKDGNQVPGWTDVSKLSAAQLKHLHPRMKKEIEQYRENLASENL